MKKKRYFDRKIASANDVLDLARNKHGLELCREIRCSVGYV
jgi:hypothetical protein